MAMWSSMCIFELFSVRGYSWIATINPVLCRQNFERQWYRENYWQCYCTNIRNMLNFHPANRLYVVIYLAKIKSHKNFGIYSKWKQWAKTLVSTYLCCPWILCNLLIVVLMIHVTQLAVELKTMRNLYLKYVFVTCLEAPYSTYNI